MVEAEARCNGHRPLTKAVLMKEGAAMAGESVPQAEVLVKRCPKCGETKAKDEFYRNKSSRDGLITYCKPCNLTRAKDYYNSARHGRRVKELFLVPKKCAMCGETKTRHLFHKCRTSYDGVSAYCKDCGCKLKTKERSESTPEQKAERAEKLAKWRREIRREVLVRYGGDPPKCACCGESTYGFLAIDHIHGGGRRHRLESGSSIEHWAKKNGFPYGLRVLCNNCNRSFGSYGYCPHSEDRSGEHKSKDTSTRRTYHRTRVAVLFHYGGNPPKCACCGEAHMEFLAIDHIAGGGTKRRKQLRANGAYIACWIIDNLFPPGFRILCHNCNMALGSHGHCPHDTSSKSRT